MNLLKKIFLFSTLFLSVSLNTYSQEKSTKIGLVLSGGGARGLAHIELLKTIDSLNIAVDYITGTSIGAVIGGLYAMGYTGKEIEYLAQTQDWRSFFENQINLKNISIEEKREYSRYIAELPIKEGKITLPNGVNNGQQLTNTLSKLFSPAYTIQDFDSLPIPFRCFATDIETGEVVTLKSGNLGEAIRASMALPTFFPPISIDNKLLSDGGLVLNFPVEEVKKMGANFIIGSYTGTKLKEKEKLVGALDILYQTNSFAEIKESNRQKDSCNILFEPNLYDIDLLDFASLDSISSYSKKSCGLIIEELEKLAHTSKTVDIEKLEFIDGIVIDDIKIHGTDFSSPQFILNKLHKTNKNSKIQFNTIEKEIDRIFGSRLFEYAYFKVDRVKGKNILSIHVKERSRSYFKFGLHYDSYNQASAIFNWTARNVFLTNSRFLVTTTLSNRPKIDLSYLKYIGQQRNMSLQLGGNFNNFDLPIYSDSRRLLSINYKYLNFYTQLQASFSQNAIAGFGIKKEFTYLSPRVKLNNFLDQKTHENTGLYFFFSINTFDKWYFPNKGTKLDAKINYNFSIRSDFQGDTISYGENEQLIINTSNQSFIKTTIDWSSYVSLHKKVVLGGFANLGYIINKNALLINGNFLGGVNDVSHLGRHFVGLSDMQILANTFAIVGLNLRVEPIRNWYISFPMNVLAYEYESLGEIVDSEISSPNRIFGYGISLGYASFLGPIQVTAHNNQVLNLWRLDFSLGFYLP